MNAPVPPRGAIRFDRFELRLESNELLRDGSKVKLKPQAARVLGLLAGRAGDAVHRDEIRDLLWGSDTFVDFDRGLNSCITQLRTALGDDPSAPRFIETLPKHGYRFVARLESEETAPREKSGRVRVMTFAAAAALGLTAIWFWPKHPEPAAPDRAMLLVRPFENLSGDEAEDYIGEGLTEELITQVSGIAPRTLGVYARTTAMRFDRLAGRPDFRVDYILEGSVRREEDRLRITARLIDAADEKALWTEVYERSSDNLLEVQPDIAARVARALLPEVSPDAYHGSTSIAEAHEAYLEGRHHIAEMSLDGFRQAVDSFQKAVALDPGYARAWAGLADAFNLQPWWGGMTPKEAARRGRAAAERALEIDPLLAEGHDALGFVSFYHDFDTREAEQHFLRAREREPGLATTHYWYAGLLSATGRHQEAVASIRRAQEIDPLSPLINADAGWYYFYAGRYPEAIRECRRILGVDPRYLWAHRCVIDAALQGGLDEDARRGLDDFARVLSAPEDLPARLRAAPTAREADRILSDWQVKSAGAAATKSAYRSPFLIALRKIGAGDAPGALDALETAYEERDGFLVHLAVDPRFQPLRAEKRFQSIVEKLGLDAE